MAPTADVLLEYRTLVVANGRAYRAQACGAPACDHTDHWHGWIEFLPVDAEAPVRTARETTQPSRTCTVYWSTGLRSAYLEGALQRALRLARGSTPSSTGAVSSNVATTNSKWSPTAARTSEIPPTTSILDGGRRFHLTAADRRFLKSLGIAPE